MQPGNYYQMIPPQYGYMPMQQIPFGGAFPQMPMPYQMQPTNSVTEVVSNYKAGLMEELKRTEVLVFLSLETTKCADPSYRVSISDPNVAGLIYAHKPPSTDGSAQKPPHPIVDFSPFLRD